jgi:hypothetical protein
MREITLTVDESGDLKFLETAMAEPFKILGTTKTRRASFVEPAPMWDRFAFTVIRWLVPDDSRIAEWTRNWNTLWRVNLKPIGGPILRFGHMYPAIHLTWKQASKVYCWGRRDAAIAAEINAVNKFFGGAK